MAVHGERQHFQKIHVQDIGPHQGCLTIFEEMKCIRDKLFEPTRNKPKMIILLVKVKGYDNY